MVYINDNNNKRTPIGVFLGMKLPDNSVSSVVTRGVT